MKPSMLPACFILAETLCDNDKAAVVQAKVSISIMVPFISSACCDKRRLHPCIFPPQEQPHELLAMEETPPLATPNTTVAMMSFVVATTQ